ncbi:hypothetical protein SDC9_135647 [bioreactor metagenome]|uniref:Uncharacterized protein n=1 Tax=bioreactor metagenome TaxID=1076179 RepID=A0A645DIA1_9ZZZZ
MHRDDGKVCHAGNGGTDKRPLFVVTVMNIQIAPREPHIGPPGGLQPAQHGVVVVGAGVHHAVFLVVVRQIVTLFPRVKGKLQHLHTGVAAAAQQLPHTGGQKAQVFGDDLPPAKLLADGADEVEPRPLAPAAIAGVGCAVGDGVIAFQPAKMVNAHGVKQLKAGGKAAHPPIIAGLGQYIPAVQRVAPQLAVG